MRNLNRNKQAIYYALYTGMEEATDSNGLYTGELVGTYSDPVKIMASVSASRGTSDVDLFGINESYSNTVIVDDMTCPISETSRLWIGVSPDDNTPHNYEVPVVARSLNHITYAVTKVDFAETPVVSG